MNISTFRFIEMDIQRFRFIGIDIETFSFMYGNEDPIIQVNILKPRLGKGCRNVQKIGYSRSFLKTLIVLHLKNTFT